METSILIIIDLSHFRGQFLQSLKNSQLCKTNKQTNKREPTLLMWGWFLFPEMRKSNVLLSAGLSVVILSDDNSSFVISHSWRLLYTCGYLWDSSSKDQSKCHFLLQVAYFWKRIQSRLCDILHQKNTEYGVQQVGLCLSHPPRGGGGVGSVTEQSRVRHNTRGKGGTQQSFIRGGSARRSDPLPFYIPFLTENVALSYTFHWKMVPLSHTYLYCIPVLNPWKAVFGRRILGENRITWRDTNQKSVSLSTWNIF